jgi:hypothetical protein
MSKSTQTYKEPERPELRAFRGGPLQTHRLLVNCGFCALYCSPFNVMSWVDVYLWRTPWGFKR